MLKMYVKIIIILGYKKNNIKTIGLALNVIFIRKFDNERQGQCEAVQFLKLLRMLQFFRRYVDIF